MTASKTPLQAAQELADYGFNVLPAGWKKKAPAVDWKQFQSNRTDRKLGQWFAGETPRNYWIATGVISRVIVLDCDNPEAEAHWRGVLGEELELTTRVKTAKGHHYYFRLEEPQPGWAVHQEGAGGLSYDVRADGGGVIAPPSTHESGMEYQWVPGRGPEAMRPRPAALVPPGAAGGGSGGGDAGGGTTRSMLTSLLQNPGRGGGGGNKAEGYNNWFTAVCGHYAKQYRTQRDAYEFHCWAAYELLRFPGSEPHPKKDAQKTLDSVWKSEQRKDEEGQPAPDNGFLLSGGNCLLAPTRAKVTGADGKESYSYDISEWADFDVVALGVVEDEDAARTYDVELVRKRFGDVRRVLLPARVMADFRSLSAWLAEYGLFIAPPDNMHPKNPTPTVRLAKYIEAQNPPHFRVVDHLGWHASGEAAGGGGFVTHEGVITKDGLSAHQGVVPHPRLRNWAPYKYGFAAEAEARAVLREVLTFHDETVCSVFGAWWAACLLKPQIHQVSSQFPFMALEAPSESGKTTGFFALMLSLAGNTQGNVNPTKAALRDYMSAHQSGIVWIDDLDDTAHLMELLRQATGEGSVAKKGEDRAVNESVQLVAPISLSGEALNLSGQKALADRAVQLAVPSPTQRRSLRPGQDHLPQWHDIVALKTKYPDLTMFAGTLVSMALRQADLVEGLPALAGASGGRFGDKLAVLRLGAGILAALTGDEEHIDRVEAWCGDADDVGSENALTLRLIPSALRNTGWRSRATGATGRWPITPVLVEAGTVWFSPGLLAEWWHEYRSGRVETRTESAGALEQQARALGLGGAVGSGKGRKRFLIDGDPSRKTVYWKLPEELSELVLDRSRGGADQAKLPSEPVIKGVHPETLRLSLEAATRREHLQDPTE